MKTIFGLAVAVVALGTGCLGASGASEQQDMAMQDVRAAADVSASGPADVPTPDIPAADPHSDPVDVLDPPGTTDVADATPATVVCPPLPSPDLDLSRFGACEGAHLPGEFTQTHADELFRRVWHEAGHLTSLLQDDASSGLLDWDEIEGGVVGILDHGHVTGAVVRSGTRGAMTACAAIRFRCWTGGHGGFGPAALQGWGEFTLVETASTHVLRVTGQFGLLEGGALEGTPSVSVDLTADLAAEPVVPTGTLGPIAK